MDDYISREEVIDSLQDWKDHCMTDAEEWHIRQVIGDVKSIPAADVQPVRHGRWVTREVLVNPIDGIWRTLVECSECGGEAFKHEVYGYQRDNFCHLCGADMRETEK